MFTIQQIQEIARKLSAMCKKDSDFQPLGERETLDKKDFIAFVKDNKNRSMTLGQLYSFIIKNQNIDIGAILSKLNTIDNKADIIIEMLRTFMASTEAHFVSVNESLKDIYDKLESIPTTKHYTITVIPTPSNATVYIDGVQRTSLEVIEGTEVSVEVTAAGYEPYRNRFVVNRDITITPKLVKIPEETATLTINTVPEGCTVKIDGLVRNSITVAKGTSVLWEVSKEGYSTKGGREEVNDTHSITVTLDAVAPNKVTFTINVISPANAVVTINGTETNSVVVDKGSEVSWSVEAPHCTPQRGTQVVNENTTKNITLLPEKVTLTVEVNPMPGAPSLEPVVTLNGTVGNSITVDSNTSVHIKVTSAISKDYEEDYVVTSTETKRVTVVSETSWEKIDLSQAEDSPNSILGVNYAGGDVHVKAVATIKYSDNTTKTKDVTTDAGTTWEVTEGTWITSKGNGVFTLTANPETNKRTAQIKCSAGRTNIESATEALKKSNLMFIIQNNDSEDYLEVVPSEVNMPADGGTKEVQIQTKGSWTIS